MSFLLTSRGLVYLTIGLNVAKFAVDEWLGRYTGPLFSLESNDSMYAMIVSMFTHIDVEDLISNMVVLFFIGHLIFIDRAYWKNPLAFLYIYLSAGFGGYFGNILVCVKLEFEWRGSASFDEIVHSLLQSSMSTRRLGATGCIYGLVGARLYTTFSSSHHASFNVCELLAHYFVLLAAFRGVPWSLEKLEASAQDELAGDRTAPFFGYVVGLFAALMWDKCWSQFSRRQAKVACILICILVSFVVMSEP